MATLDEQESNARSIRDILTDINRLTEENLNLEKQKLATEERINSEQQDISNTIKDQTKQLQFQKAEKSAILRSTNSISRVSENITTFQKQELIDSKAIAKLGKDKLKIDKDISLLKQTQQKLTKDTAGLTSGQIIANYALAESIDDQVKNAIILKAEISAIESSSNNVFSKDGITSMKFMSDALSKVPGLSVFSSTFDEAGKAASKVVGEMESTNFGIDKFKALRAEGVGIKDAMSQAGVNSQQIKAGKFTEGQMNMTSIMTSAKSLVKSMKAALAPAALLAMFLNAFIKSDKAAGDLAKSMNMTYKESLATRRELKKSADLSFSNKVTTQGMQDSLVAMSKALGTNTMLSKEMLVQFTEMREYAGFTNEELQGIAAISLTTGKTMNEVTGEFMAQAQISATQNGVLLNEKELLKDIGNVSAATTLSLGKNPSLIADAVATAKSLGMELSKVDSIASSLLDFESSIANELEAELLLGKDINLEKARQAALNNDLATVAKEISNQMGDSAEFSEMNRIQQEALAKSVGMSREDLAQTLFVQEQLKGATGDEAQEREKLLNNRIAEVGLEQAQKELAEEGVEGLREQASQASRLSNTLTKVQELFVAIAEPILVLTDLLLPVVEFIGSMVSGIMAFSTMVGESIAYVGNLAEGLGPLSGILKGIAGVAILLAGYLAYGALAWIPVVGPILGLAASATVITAGFSALASKPKKTGDMYSANGKTLVSPAEGGLFELSNNDEFAAAPGLGAMIANNNNNNNNSNPPTQTVVQQDNSESKKTNALLEALINRPAPRVQMDSIEVGTVAGMSAFSIQ